MKTKLQKTERKNTKHFGVSPILNTLYSIHHTRGGFTIIELLVTVAIFSIITSVLLVNYPKFSSRILLENVAHDIGLSVRQAQTFGLNVRGVRIGATDIFPTYGIHFSLGGGEVDPSDRRHFLILRIFCQMRKIRQKTTRYTTKHQIASCREVSASISFPFKQRNAYIFCAQTSNQPGPR